MKLRTGLSVSTFITSEQANASLNGPDSYWGVHRLASSLQIQAHHPPNPK